MRVLSVTQKNNFDSYEQDIYGTVSEHSGERESSS